MNGKLAWTLVLGAAGLLAGCPSSSTEPGNGPAPTELAPMAIPPIPEVPLPVGFRLIEDRSLSMIRPGVQMIAHTYRGPADKYAVRRFYWKQMPLSGWVRRSENDVHSVAVMDWDKEGGDCRITIQDGGLFDKTEIKIEVHTIEKAAPGGPRK